AEENRRVDRRSDHDNKLRSDAQSAGRIPESASECNEDCECPERSGRSDPDRLRHAKAGGSSKESSPQSHACGSRAAGPRTKRSAERREGEVMFRRLMLLNVILSALLIAGVTRLRHDMRGFSATHRVDQVQPESDKPLPKPVNSAALSNKQEWT